ncbi:NSP3 [Rotavirus L]|nr:NSP3 [Rotavirus L]
MAAIVVSVLNNILKDHENKDQIVEKFSEALNDSGLSEQIDNWRKSFYSLRIPKQMSNTSIHHQLMNFESEIINLRSQKYAEGLNRKLRTLNGFELAKNSRGFTTLIPTTRLTELILANTYTDNYHLPAISNIEVEQILADRDDFREQLAYYSNEVSRLQIEIDELNEQNFKLRTNLEKVSNTNHSLVSIQTSMRSELNETKKAMLVSQTYNASFISKLASAETHITWQAVELDNRERLIINLCKQLGYECHTENDYIKDLTTEGVEPNPGPATCFADLYNFLIAINLKVLHYFNYDFKTETHYVQLTCLELNHDEIIETDDEADIYRMIYNHIYILLLKNRKYIDERRPEISKEYIGEMMTKLNSGYITLNSSGFLYPASESEIYDYINPFYDSDDDMDFENIDSYFDEWSQLNGPPPPPPPPTE